MRQITHVLIHHSQTADGKTLSWDDIKDYHINTNGWSDIGYHYGLEQIEDSLQILVGRMLNEHGAHCPQEGMNSKSIGICVVGNYDLEPPAEEKLVLLARLVKSLMEIFNIPAENVKGHRNYNAAKTCPGTKFNLGAFRERLTA